MLNNDFRCLVKHHRLMMMAIREAQGNNSAWKYSGTHETLWNALKYFDTLWHTLIQPFSECLQASAYSALAFWGSNYYQEWRKFRTHHFQTKVVFAGSWLGIQVDNLSSWGYNTELSLSPSETHGRLHVRSSNVRERSMTNVICQNSVQTIHSICSDGIHPERMQGWEPVW